MKKEINKIGMAFGLFDETMIPKLQWLLKPFGLRLIVKSNPAEWGDQVAVSIRGTKTAAVLGSMGGTARAKRMTPEERQASARRAAQGRWGKLIEGTGYVYQLQTKKGKEGQ